MKNLFNKYLCNKMFIGSLLLSLLSLIFFLPLIHGQTAALEPNILNLPSSMLKTTPKFVPPNIKGLIVYPKNPLRLDFIVNTGDAALNDTEFKNEAMKLIKYFLASLTIPKKDQWVNLSPYEENKIIVDSLGQTALGTDLLSQDYILKQLTASLISPEDKLGKEFWNNVYKQAYEKYGTTDIPVDTYNKVWIVPNKAVVYQDDNMVFVAEANLKVMLEADYMAEKAKDQPNLKERDEGLIDNSTPLDQEGNPKNITSKIIKEIIIPAIEKEVNEGKNFADMRQIYNSLILAAWYEQTLKQSIMQKLYIDKSKINGINITDKELAEKIYQKYIEAYKKGVYNYVKEDYDPATQLVIPKKYFSGGFTNNITAEIAKMPENLIGEISNDDHNKLVKLLLNITNDNIQPKEGVYPGLLPPSTRGGIDMDNIRVIDNGDKITFELDSKELASIFENEFGGFLPEIIAVLPINSVLPESVNNTK